MRCLAALIGCGLLLGAAGAQGPAPAPATQGDAPTGKTLADVRLGDYRIGEARDAKTGPERRRSKRVEQEETLL